MQGFWFGTCLVISLVTVESRLHAPDEIPDGIYALAPADEGKKISTGPRDIWLGELVADQLGQVSLISQNNQNSRFQLRLDGCGPVNKEGQLVSLTAVVIDGIAMVITGRSNTPEDDKGKMMLSAQVYGGATAEKIARRLNIKVEKRTHPGHRLMVTWTPVKKTFNQMEPVQLELEIHNVGDETVFFHDGGMQRGFRNNQFSFSCFHNLKPVTDIGNPNHFGGLAALIRLPPGESFKKRVDLRDWFSMDETGQYELIGSFYLGLQESAEEYRLIWEDYVTGPARVTIADDSE